MNNFTINTNEYLKYNIKGYYHTDYMGYRNLGNPDYLNHLKNTFDDFSSYKLDEATKKLKKVLKNDLKKIFKKYRNTSLTVCVVPRSKSERKYSKNQLLFRKTVKKIINKLNERYGINFNDGSKYIKRQVDTITTHLSHTEYAGKGKMPYPGITKDTCIISDNVRGKDILLIDDIYTNGVNIDEDAIQALLDNGANSVIFYAIGKAG